MKSLFIERIGLDFFQNSKTGKVLRALTLTDLSFWSSRAFINVVLILYVVQFIQGGSATHFGLAYFVFKAVGAGLSIPVGRFFDTHKGYIDELWGLIFSTAGTGILYILLSFSTQLWQLYAAMFFLGLFSIINITSWRILFYNSIKKEQYGQTIGVYQSIFTLGEALAVALAGFFGDTFGFDKVVLVGGIIISLGSLIPLSIKYFVPRK